MRGASSPALRDRLAAVLMRSWWRTQPGALATVLKPLSRVYAAAARRQGNQAQQQHAPVPVLVVGNFVVGGAGKTPTVIALAKAFRAAGHHPGIVSRGFGRESNGARAVRPGDDPLQVGDEPLLIARQTGAPVWVGRDRVAAARALCATEPGVDLLISDDGLQHHALARNAELIVFDDRGAGNGLLLPAGPLREPVPAVLATHQSLLYTGSRRSTALPGHLVTRKAAYAHRLSDWRAAAGTGSAASGVPLGTLQDRRLVAVAGMADPGKFFDMLEAAGLQIERLPLPDHHPYPQLPWPDDSESVITTEKDAVKLDPSRLPGLRAATPQVWVVPLDLVLPESLLAELGARLFPPLV